MRLRKLIPVVLCIVMLSLAAPAQKQDGGEAQKNPGTAGVPAPVVSEINTQALKNMVAQRKERPLLVNFWATWCDPCRDEFPELVKINSDYKERSLEFITVSLDDVQAIKTDVPKFLSSMKATMPAYLLNVPDPEPAINAVDPKWQGDLPATFLYGADGTLAYKHFGRVDAAELRAAIDKLIPAR